MKNLEIKDLIRKTNVDGALESKDTIYFDNNIRNPFLNYNSSINVIISLNGISFESTSRAL